MADTKGFFSVCLSIGKEEEEEVEEEAEQVVATVMRSAGRLARRKEQGFPGSEGCRDGERRPQNWKPTPHPDNAITICYGGNRGGLRPQPLAAPPPLPHPPAATSAANPAGIRSDHHNRRQHMIKAMNQGRKVLNQRRRRRTRTRDMAREKERKGEGGDKFNRQGLILQMSPLTPGDRK